MSRKKQVQRMLRLRPAREDDMPTINAYCYNEGMDNLPDLEGVTVAVDADDDPIGVIRVAVSDGVAYVNPVVVNPYWRGYGVGRRLMENELEEYGELRLVSRGNSLDFYRRLGCTDIPWEDIEMSMVDDCDHCDMREECHPQPVKLVKQSS